MTTETGQRDTTEETADVLYQVGSSWHKQPTSKGAWYDAGVGRFYVGAYPVAKDLRSYSRQFLADYTMLNVRSLCSNVEVLATRTVPIDLFPSFEYDFRARCDNEETIGRSRFVYVDGNEVELSFFEPTAEVTRGEGVRDAFFSSLHMSPTTPADEPSAAPSGPPGDAALVGIWSVARVVAPDRTAPVPTSESDAKGLATVTLTLYDDHHYLYVIGASQKEAHGTWQTRTDSLRLVNAEGVSEYTIQDGEIFQAAGSYGFFVFTKK